MTTLTPASFTRRRSTIVRVGPIVHCLLCKAVWRIPQDGTILSGWNQCPGAGCASMRNFWESVKGADTEHSESAQRVRELRREKEQARLRKRYQKSRALSQTFTGNREGGPVKMSPDELAAFEAAKAKNPDLLPAGTYVLGGSSSPVMRPDDPDGLVRFPGSQSSPGCTLPANHPYVLALKKQQAAKALRAPLGPLERR